MKLFDDKERIDINPAKHLDNTYDYYDRCGLETIANKRSILIQWFEKYPDSEKIELKSRFKKKFSSAFFELFLHELFRKQGFSLDPHPKLPNTEKRPDFLVRKDGLEFYLEAKEVEDMSKQETGNANRINTLYDTLNKTKSPNFFFAIDELLLKDKKQPNGKEIVKFLESQLENFDPDIVAKEYEERGYNYRAKIEFENESIRIVISLIPKKIEARGKDNSRPIGIYGTEVTWGGPEESIRKAIAKKAMRYGDLDKPYLICINSTSERGTHEFDIMNLLFGRVQVTFSTDPNNRDEKWTRKMDGIFMNQFGKQYTRVSGIFITSINQSNFHVENHWFVKHPFSTKELNMNTFDLTYFEVLNGKIVKQDGKRMGEIL